MEMRLEQFTVPFLKEDQDQGGVLADMFAAVRGAGELVLSDPEGNIVGVLLTRKRYALLRTTADLAVDPNRYFHLHEKNQRFQSGAEIGSELTSGQSLRQMRLEALASRADTSEPD